MEREHRTYPESIRESAYQHWRQTRSTRTTGRSLDIPDRTIREWLRADGWARRALDDDGRDAEIMRQHARMQLVSDLDVMIGEVRDIARSATDRDGNPDYRTRLAALRLAFDLDGGFGRDGQDASHARQNDRGVTNGLPRALSDTDRASAILRILGTTKEGG